MSDDQQVKDFIRANDKSRVIAGSVLDTKKGGAIYTLQNGMMFKLNLEECRALPAGYPKWKL